MAVPSRMGPGDGANSRLCPPPPRRSLNSIVAQLGATAPTGRLPLGAAASLFE
jgi:hypothetical protein